MFKIASKELKNFDFKINGAAVLKEVKKRHPELTDKSQEKLALVICQTIKSDLVETLDNKILDCIETFKVYVKGLDKRSTPIARKILDAMKLESKLIKENNQDESDFNKKTLWSRRFIQLNFSQEFKNMKTNEFETYTEHTFKDKSRLFVFYDDTFSWFWK